MARATPFFTNRMSLVSPSSWFVLQRRTVTSAPSPAVGVDLVGPAQGAQLAGRMTAMNSSPRDYHIDEAATLGGAMVGLDAAAALGYDEGGDPPGRSRRRVIRRGARRGTSQKFQFKERLKLSLRLTGWT